MRAHGFTNGHLIIGALPTIPAHNVSGYAEGNDAIQFKRVGPSYKYKVGADGKASVSRSANKAGLITIKLDQLSASNRVLAAILSLQESDVPGAYVPMFVSNTDIYRGDAMGGLFGVITKWPDLSRGEEVNDQEWEIFVERLDIVLGAPTFAGLPSATAEIAGL